MAIEDNASIALIPSGYKSGKLYSVIPDSGNGDFTHSRGSTATRVAASGLIETVASGVPRLDYPLIDGVVQDCPALLLEPSRTNRLPYSNNFTTSDWVKSSGGTGTTPTITADYAISPDGSQNASRLQINKGSGTTSSDYSAIEDNISFFSSIGSLSIWIKSNDTNTYKIALRNYNDIVVCNVTTQWQRFDFENATNPTMFQLILRGTYGTSDSADLLIYGAQLEEGSYKTSYVKTSGSAATRSADVCNGSGTSAEFNDSEGVLFAEIAALADDLTFRVITLSDSSTSDFIKIGYRNTSNVIYYTIDSGSSNQSFQTYTATDIKLSNKIAIKYKSGDISLFFNGFEVLTDTTSTTMPVGLNQLSFDDGIGGSDFYGKTKQLMTFKTALTDSELETLTSWDSFNAMAKGQLYTIE
jgi:hypothetical protein